MAASAALERDPLAILAAFPGVGVKEIGDKTWFFRHTFSVLIITFPRRYSLGVYMCSGNVPDHNELVTTPLAGHAL